jgi:hypothetical protein
VLTDQLERCSALLRKAVAYMSVIPGTPQEKLRGMVAKTGFGSLAEYDFPSGTFRDNFHAIAGQMSDDPESQFDSIKAMSDERARRVIDQISKLSDAVSHALGGQQ